MNQYKKDFPIFRRKIHKKNLIYLDNAATTQVPQQVIDAVVDFESNHRANVHRGIHTLSEEATKIYEESREVVARFIHAVVPSEVVFVRNATEAINFVAYGWGRNNLKKNDVILVSEVEHHSNLVPWQALCEEIGCKLEFIPVNKKGELDIKKVKVDWDRVKLITLVHVSNVLGTINDVKSVVKYVKKRFVEAKSDSFPRVLVDGAQSIPRMPINVKKLGIDFFAFSGHKMCGPMGIGVLWINRAIVDEVIPYLKGGGMIKEVKYTKSSFSSVPEKFEAGTPNVAGAVGLAEACNYLSSIGMDHIYGHETELTRYALDKLSLRKDVIIYGTLDTQKRLGVIAFNLKRIPSHDLATILDTEGIAIRSGHHCVMPWHKKQKITTSARISFYLYNDKNDIDMLLKGLDKAKKILGK